MQLENFDYIYVELMKEAFTDICSIQLGYTGLLLSIINVPKRTIGSKLVLRKRFLSFFAVKLQQIRYLQKPKVLAIPDVINLTNF